MPVTPEKWRRIGAELAALDSLNAGQRPAYLAELKRRDADLAAALESYLVAVPPESFLASPAGSEPALTPGTRLGPYEVGAAIGAGGMGEVYRAHDTRLARDVAVKLVAPHLAADEPSRRRLEREARMVASVSHPNVISLYDVGEHEGSVYLVMELLNGRTLRERLQEGRLPEQSIVDLGIQVARGLAAAHAQGLVHRDLKPENLFLTRDGIVKILDFGIAKPSAADAVHARPTMATAPGTLVGTLAYMSPEQITGENVDARSDLFALGVVLHEAATGHAAFERATSRETMTAILSGQLPDADVSPALARIIRRCLAKAPGDRYQSAADLAFSFEMIGADADKMASAPVVDRKRFRWTGVAAGAAVGIVLAAGGYIAAGTTGQSDQLALHRFTFRQGQVTDARFAPDGQVVVYSASWDGEPYRLYQTRLGRMDSRPMDLPPADLLGLSREGTLALSLDRPAVDGFEPHGVLAVVGLAGGAPRALQDDIVGADFGPDGEIAALVRRAGNNSELEFPVGTKIHRSDRVVLPPRVSRDGQRVCFFSPYDTLMVAERGMPARPLLNDRHAGQRCTWSPDGSEVWFAEEVSAGTANIEAVDLNGRRRVLAALTGNVTLEDVSADGTGLITAGALRYSVTGDDGRDLSILNATRIGHLRADGKQLLLWDNRAPPGEPTISLRPMDGSDPVYLTTGIPLALSPDGKSAAVVQSETGAATGRLLIVPTGAGNAHAIDLPIEIHHQVADFTGRNPWAWKVADFSEDGHRLLIPFGSAAGRPPRVYVHDLVDGWTRPVTPEGVTGPAVLSPDGRFVASNDAGTLVTYSVADGSRRELPGGPEPGRLARWDSSGRFLYLVEQAGAGVHVIRRDLETGRRAVIREITSSDPAGVIQFDAWISRNGRVAAHTIDRMTSNLYAIEGLR